MSELGDTIVALQAQQAQLDAHAEKIAAQDRKLSEHDRFFAQLDVMEKHLDERITALQDDVREGFRRIRLGFNGK